MSASRYTRWKVSFLTARRSASPMSVQLMGMEGPRRAYIPSAVRSALVSSSQLARIGSAGSDIMPNLLKRKSELGPTLCAGWLSSEAFGVPARSGLSSARPADPRGLAVFISDFFSSAFAYKHLAHLHSDCWCPTSCSLSAQLVMDIDDEAPPALIDVGPTSGKQEASDLQNVTMGLETLEVTKVPLTIVTGKASSQQEDVGPAG